MFLACCNLCQKELRKVFLKGIMWSESVCYDLVKGLFCLHGLVKGGLYGMVLGRGDLQC